MKNKSKKINTKENPAVKEFDLAFHEFFENKPKPKNDEEEKKQMEEFMHWYNNIRKQSDTRKTPVEMYKEIYGKEPPEKPVEISRMINSEWDENYKEPDELLQEADEFINKGEYAKALKCVDEALEIIEDDEIILMKAEILNYLRREPLKYMIQLKEILNKKIKNVCTSFLFSKNDSTYVLRLGGWPLRHERI